VLDDDWEESALFPLFLSSFAQEEFQLISSLLAGRKNWYLIIMLPKVFEVHRNFKLRFCLEPGIAPVGSENSDLRLVTRWLIDAFIATP